VQTELEDAEERADNAEGTLQKLRAKNRSSVSVARTSASPAAGVTVTKTRITKRSESVF